MKRKLLFFAVFLFLACQTEKSNIDDAKKFIEIKPSPEASPEPTPSPDLTPELSPTPSPTIEPSPTVEPSPTSVGGIPVPNHPLSFGYYFADGKYGDYRANLNCHTNLYIAVARDGYSKDSEAPDDVWIPDMRNGIREAFEAGKEIYLNMALHRENIPVDRVLSLAKPYWSAVKYFEMADEPGWPKADTEKRIKDMKDKMRAKGLSIPPIGIVFTRDQLLHEDTVLANNLDWAGVEAYVDAPGSETSSVNVDALKSFLKKAKARVPQDKKMIFIMQAYSRNYFWKNINTLADLQIPTYLEAYNDPRVVALTMFSYGRPSGTFEYMKLRKRHVQIGNAIFNKTCQ